MNINKIIGNINNRIILASKSPRRKHLLSLLGLSFDVVPSDIDENISETNPEVFALKLSELKAKDIARKHHGCLVIGADTIVIQNDRIINKPEDENNAFDMLRGLSDDTHRVITGICISMYKNGKLNSISAFESTKVTFRHLSDAEILEYIKTGSPMDKAGAYGIQDDFGAVFVSGINGCYYNIVGLPLHLLYIKLKEFHNNFL